MAALLQDQLDAITARTRALVQADRLAVSERAAAELFATGIEDRILPVGGDRSGVCAAGCQNGADGSA